MSVHHAPRAFIGRGGNPAAGFDGLRATAHRRAEARGRAALLKVNLKAGTSIVLMKRAQTLAWLPFVRAGLRKRAERGSGRVGVETSPELVATTSATSPPGVKMIDRLW